MSSDRHRISITDIKLRFAEAGTDGLLAWASCVVSGGIFLNNIAVRQGRNGRMFCTYPAKKTASGATHHYFNPISREAAEAVERAILFRLEGLIAVDRHQDGM
jgi:DNA-binding cell septation regulator SpoVG